MAKKSGMGGLPIAKMHRGDAKSAGPATTKLASGNPNVVSEAKKKTVPAAMGTAAKARADRPGFKKGGSC